MTLQVLVSFHRQKRDAVTRVDAHRPGGQQECAHVQLWWLEWQQQRAWGQWWPRCSAPPTPPPCNGGRGGNGCQRYSGITATATSSSSQQQVRWQRQPREQCQRRHHHCYAQALGVVDVGSLSVELSWRIRVRSGRPSCRASQGQNHGVRRGYRGSGEVRQSA